MKHDTPRATDGAKLCAWCGELIQQVKVGRSRDYCKRSCRQRAYEARKQREAVVAAVASAVARRPSDSSRDEMARPRISSRDESKPAGPAPVSAPAAPVADPVLPSTWRASPSVPLPPSRSKRRRLLPPPPGQQRPLFDGDGE